MVGNGLNPGNGARSNMDKDTIQQIHNRADYEDLHATTRTILDDVLNELYSVDIALSREQPKIEHIRDVVQALVDRLNNYYITLDR